MDIIVVLIYYLIFELFIYIDNEIKQLETI